MTEKLKTSLLASLDVHVDPVTAAVQAERKRWEAAARSYLEGKCEWRATATNTLFAAIDAPATEVNAFLRGGEALRTEALNKIARLSAAAESDPCKKLAEQRIEAYRGAQNCIGRISLMEPS